MLEKLFEKVNSELLTDEVKLELSAIFESQLNEAIAAKEQELEEANKQEIADFKDEMITKLDEYLAYFVEEFTKEQETQIVEAVKVDRATEVLGIFEELVKKFNISLDERAIEDNTELKEAKKKLSEQTEELITLRKEMDQMKVAQIVEGKAAEFATDGERDRFRKLAETISFAGDAAEFSKKLSIVAESVKGSEKSDPPQKLQEEEDKDADGADQKLEEQQTTTKRYMRYL